MPYDILASRGAWKGRPPWPPACFLSSQDDIQVCRKGGWEQNSGDKGKCQPAPSVPTKKGNCISSQSSTRAQPQRRPLPVRRGDRRTQWHPPSDGLRSGETCWPCPSAQHTGVQTPGAAPTGPLQRRQPSWLARGAEAASFLSSSGWSITFHARPPSSMKKKREGGQATYPRRNSLRKSHPCCLGFSGHPGSWEKMLSRSPSAPASVFRVRVPVPRLSSQWHPGSPCLCFPPSLSLGPVPFWPVTQHQPPTPHLDAAAWVLVNYTGSVNYTSERGPSGLKEDTVLFMLHLHTCILDSIFKSDNKSMVPRGGRWKKSCLSPPQAESFRTHCQPFVDNSPLEGRSVLRTTPPSHCSTTPPSPAGDGRWLTFSLVV